jgi:uncharacterized protein (DUF1684 family)
MKWFVNDEKWVLRGRWEAKKCDTLVVGTDKGLSEKSDFGGQIVFSFEGEEVRLWADQTNDKLFIVFKDKTAKDGETYGAGRFLYARVAEDESVLLDFNRAYNPACAYTEFALCPLPVKVSLCAKIMFLIEESLLQDNVLPFRIAAGEMKP